MAEGAKRSRLLSAVDALLESASPLPVPTERKRLREAHGLTQEQLANAMNVRRATVSAWEAGKAEPRQPEREAYGRLLAKLAERHPVADAAGPRQAPARPALPAGPPAARRTRQGRGTSPAALERMFSTLLHSAWRLESRSRYAWHERRPEYTAFATGRHVHWDLQSAWCRNRREQTALGKTFQRVRVIDEPYTECQLYLLLQNTPRNAASGEDVRFLTRGRADALELPREDFWIFDARTVALFRFDDDTDDTDDRDGVEIVTSPAEVLRYVQVREAAWHHAVSQERMAALLGV
ncbi:helix-turn-helix transcriptional regulator [Streptomyces sp. NPDC059894]|uniref:helix-turn-helix transcriptional regulator n=1 Tax=unclassified Streptomyces TaxID=2593676 RepID=UPI003656992D